MKTIALSIIVFAAAFGITTALQASGMHVDKSVTNIYPTTITSGITDDNLAKGLAASFSNSHQFDYGTPAYQGSIVGAWYDGQNAVSFGAARNFEAMDALWHGSITQISSDEVFVIGATFRF